MWHDSTARSSCSSALLGRTRTGKKPTPLLSVLPAHALEVSRSAERATARTIWLSESCPQGACGPTSGRCRTGPAPAFSRFPYRYRNLVERFFNKLEHLRGVATRYDKHADNHLAGVKLASVRIWLRFNESMAWWAARWLRRTPPTRLRLAAPSRTGPWDHRDRRAGRARRTSRSL